MERTPPPPGPTKKSKRPTLGKFCFINFKMFLQNTTLHALNFVADSSLSGWERFLFFCAFVAAIFYSFNLLSNIYARWSSTPVITGISPHPTSILITPFPAVTVCNMNNVLRSKVENFTKDSPEQALLSMLCNGDTEYEEAFSTTINRSRSDNYKLSSFILENCDRLFMACEVGSMPYNCSDLFREIITDEGICCVFNMLHPKFLYTKRLNTIPYKEMHDGSVPVNWDLETGYPSQLPKTYYPRVAVGTGVSLGVSVIMNAEQNEYYCSSTNGPGFKVALHNAVETSRVKENGFIVSVGTETRVRITAQRSEAVVSLRNLNKNERKCLFNGEEPLLYHRHYTRRNCDSECQTKFIYRHCNCIPHHLPPIYLNVSECTVERNHCVKEANRIWSTETYNDNCRSRCLPSCYDLTFKPDAFPGPLARRNFSLLNPTLNRMNKKYLANNIAVLHFYYQEYIFQGDLKNVYTGTTEFLSSTGGIMGLFLGFSFISIIEVFYFISVRPFIELVLYRGRHLQQSIEVKLNTVDVIQIENQTNWLSSEIHKPLKRLSKHTLGSNKFSLYNKSGSLAKNAWKKLKKAPKSLIGK